MQLISLESNEVLSERAVELGFRIEGTTYWPDKSYEYVVGLTFDGETFPTTDSFFLHRSITATSAQDAQRRAAKEIYRQFASIVTPRVPLGFDVKKHVKLGYSDIQIRDLIDEHIDSPATDLRHDRREGRSNESFINLRIDLWDDKDIQIQYPNIWYAQKKIYEEKARLAPRLHVNPDPQFPLYLRLYNDYDRAMKSDSYKGKTFKECLDENSFWWDVPINQSEPVQLAFDLTVS